MNSLIPWSSLNIAGVAFLKAVPEGTYDAIIVDSSDPIGNHISYQWKFGKYFRNKKERTGDQYL